MYIEFQPEDAAELMRNGYSLGQVLVMLISEWGLDGSKEWEQSFAKGVASQKDDSARHTLHGMSYLCKLMANLTTDDNLKELTKTYAKAIDDRMEEIDLEEIRQRKANKLA